MRLLYVPINQEALDRLREIAILEKRRPQDQAAFLLEQSLGLREPHSQATELVAKHTDRRNQTNIEMSS